MCKITLSGHSELIKDKCRHSANCKRGYRIGHHKRTFRLACISVRMEPIAKAERHKPFFILFLRNIIYISQNARCVFFKNPFVAPIFISIKRNKCQCTVPNRTVTPFVAPTVRRNNSRQSAVLTLSLSDVSQPFNIAVFNSEIEEHMLRG